MAADITPRWSADTEELVKLAIGDCRYDDGSTEQAVNVLTVLANAGALAGPAALLTDDEHKAVHDAGQLYNLLCRIVGHGPSRDGDISELIGHVHGIQQAVLKQAAGRAYPDRYRLLGGMIGDPMPAEAPAMPLRCPSCEHLDEYHQPEGCWFTAVRGTVGANLVCPCIVAYPEPTTERLRANALNHDNEPGPAAQLQEVMRVGAVRVVEQIRLTHVRDVMNCCSSCGVVWSCPTIAIVESVEPWASLVRDGRVVQP